MEIRPIVAALGRNKAGVVLAVIQIALTLAIVSNIVSIVANRYVSITRPTGVREHELFALGYRLTSGVASVAGLQTDLASIRATPGVVDAIATNSYPLRNSGWFDGVSLAPGATTVRQQSAQTAVYVMDQRGIGTLGVKLIEGRNFAALDVEPGHLTVAPLPRVAIVSRALARQLFPHDAATGKQIYLTADPRKPILIVGVVDRLQAPAAAGTTDEHASENSLILPMAITGPVVFVVRVRPGVMDHTMHEVQNALTVNNPNRIFGRLRPFDEIRASAYQKDRAIAIALTIVCGVLIAVTAFAIVGLTSFWVVRRRTQIGLRRAMGATRLGIVRYFLIENAALCLIGVLPGVVAALALNLWLSGHYGADRLPLSQLLVSAVLVIALGQLAAAFPALRAARTSPTDALRAL